MTNEQAWLYAAEWGSYIRNGDPGACMYGFDERFTVQSEAHRQACLDWIANECLPCVNARPADYDDDECARLHTLAHKVRRAPIG